MKILKLLQKHNAILGLDPPKPFQTHPFNVKNVVSMLLLGQFFILSCAFLALEAESFSDYAGSFYVTVTMFAAGFNFVIRVFKSAEVFELIQNFENTIQKRLNNERSKIIYEKANAQVEEWTQMLNFSCMRITLPCLLVPNFIICYAAYFLSDAGSDAFTLPFPIWVPFVYTTPLRYLFVFAIQFAGLYVMCKGCACVLGCFIGTSVMLIALVVDIQLNMNNMPINETSANMDTKQILSEFIDLHSNAKQLFYDSVSIFSFIIFCFFVWSLLTICSTLLMVQFELDHSGITLILVTQLCLMFWSFALVFFFCHFGENIKGQFSELNDVIYESNWYLCANEMQRMIPMILAATQNEPILRGFGNAVCSRDSFQKVVNSGFSYYMMLHEL